MAGKRGRSGGRNRLTVEAHMARGTYRRDRHGPLPDRSNVAVMPVVAAGWQPEPAQLEAVAQPGRDLVTRLLLAYDFSLAEGVLLLELGHAAASLASVRGVRRSGLTIREALALERTELGWQRQVANLILQLKVQL